jgi:glycosyltransferase involved in cell wall biosynthesis
MRDYVKLLGRRTDVGTILLASDANLLTSRLEGCPNVALEAQSLGVSIVATAAGGTPETVDHGVTGFLAGVGDAENLARHLTRVLTDNSLRSQLSAAGPVFVAQRFGLERMIDETLALYTRAVQGDGKRFTTTAAA